MGDISAIMPAIHPHIGGAEGVGHSENYSIVDPELAYIVGAKAMAMTVIDLLWDGAKAALDIKKAFTPALQQGILPEDVGRPAFVEPN